MLALPRDVSRMLANIFDEDAVPYHHHGYPMMNRCPARNPSAMSMLERYPFEMPMPQIKDGMFTADFDLRNFDPNGIQVKVDGDMLQVNAKQEKKGDGHYEYREFVRKINLPKEVAQEQLKCKLDKDGVLRVQAPVKQLAIKQEERNIPIQMINQK